MSSFRDVQQTSQHGGLLVVRHGYLGYEKYFGRDNRGALPELVSCGKAFTSIGAGSFAVRIELGFPHDFYSREAVLAICYGGLRDKIMA
jgi:hypothetical protein